MTDRLRIALAQLNPTVGAIAANLEKAFANVDKALASNADIIMFPELYLSGYFPEDLLFKPQFADDVIAAVHALAKRTEGTGLHVLVPTVWRHEGHLVNALAVCANGNVRDIRVKHDLPNDDVFYEKRYFRPGPLPEPVEINGVSVGLPICEDVWQPNVCAHLAHRGAEIMLCPNGSPYWHNKHYLRRELVRDRIEETGVPILYLNQVGGQDELVYDGASFGMDEKGNLVFEGESFLEDFIVTDWTRHGQTWACDKGPMVDLVSTDEAPWRAAVLGLRDYVRKNGFSKVVLGLSGGIDSAIVATMAVDALGPKNVHCVMMPYHYTSSQSVSDAEKLAQILGVRYDSVAIDTPVDAALERLGPLFHDRAVDITEENIQSRMRGTILMAISNKLGAMLLTTGNKSEMAVGYATIYGDMNGGFNPIKDLLKMQVYHLADWRNKNMPADCLGPTGEVIPRAIIDKAPSAELRPDQTDQDSLPPYPVLDALIEGLIEHEKSVADLVAEGFDHALVKSIERLIYLSEYKRRQSAPGVKMSIKAFGIGRKYPITNGYRDESGMNKESGKK